MMKKIVIGLLILTSLTFNLSAQANSSYDASTFPAGFKSDGCSLFPDGDYRDCCVAHDLVYFSGGSWKARWQADNQLRKCVADKKGFQHKPLSIMMWLGVRAGGVPWLPMPFRWGFGRNSEKK
jgi:hypothetical protein